MQSNPAISAKTIAAELGMTSRNVDLHIRSMKNAGVIERVGSARSGHWEVKIVIGDNFGSNFGDGDSIGENFGDNFGENKTWVQILRLMRSNPTISAKAIATERGMTPRNVEVHIRSMRDAGLVERVGGG